MKKRIFLFLATALALAFTSCHDKPGNQDTPDNPDTPTVTESELVFDGTTYTGLRAIMAYYGEEGCEYGFYSGSVVAPDCNLNLSSASYLTVGTYTFGPELHGDIYRLADDSFQEIASGTLTVSEVEHEYRFEVEALTGGGLTVTMTYWGPMETMNDAGTGTFVMGDLTLSVDCAALYCIPEMGLNINVLSFVNMAGDDVCQIDFCRVGLPFDPGTYPITADQTQILAGSVFGLVETDDATYEPVSGSLTVAKEVEQYTVSASGEMDYGSAFTFTYTGRVLSFSKRHRR